MPSQPTTIAGRFDVERAVGRGGMGTVWLCRDQRLGRQVAVKQVGLLPGESRTQLGRALREARSSAALNHPNVVAVYDAVEEGDHAWLVMEYVPSRTLHEIVSAEGPLSPEQAARLGAQAADGLAAAHAQGVVHRDVKPSNVLVTDEGQVKITDFGIARTHGQEALTRTGIVMGTPGYFSPELARGEEPQPTADVWALGATLFTAVEGHGPYPEQGNALAVLARIATDPPPHPESAGLLTEAITKMMDPDPATRWTMAEAARELHRLGSPGAVVTPADEEPTSVLPTPVAPVAAAAAVPPTPPETPLPPPEEDERRRRPVLLVLAVVVLLALVAGGVVLGLTSGDDDDPGAADDTSAPSRTDRPSRSAAAPATSAAPEEPEPSSEPVEPEPEETETETQTEEPAPTGDAAEFASGYYGLLPSDPGSAYALLSPDYQARTSSSDYEGFWRTISAVEVRGTRVVDDTTVDVDLTYTSSDGTTEDETRRLYLEPAGDGFVIADDEAV